MADHDLGQEHTFWFLQLGAERREFLVQPAPNSGGGSIVTTVVQAEEMMLTPWARYRLQVVNGQWPRLHHWPTGSNSEGDFQTLTSGSLYSIRHDHPPAEGVSVQQMQHLRIWQHLCLMGVRGAIEYSQGQSVTSGPNSFAYRCLSPCEVDVHMNDRERGIVESGICKEVVATDGRVFAGESWETYGPLQKRDFGFDQATFAVWGIKRPNGSVNWKWAHYNNGAVLDRVVTEMMLVQAEPFATDLLEQPFAQAPTATGGSS